ncbi:MAG: methyltransferase domain-containing protein [Bacteroidia bacterium]|nr:class I SAM-dependent methyltransferase [Bacteroidia bacterium]NNC85506.1 methyltransferase domain-containing protein [Bacteroidia bacterium]NNM16507.1 methyltransferase domain-containing protein [Bacteroidia bacterium]
MSNHIEIISEPEKVDMADSWFELADPNHFWSKGRLRAIFKNGLLDTLNNNKVLEVGCGSGLVINQFNHYPNVALDGCDLNMFAMEQIGKMNGNLYCLNIYDKPEKLLNQYKGVLLMDVIEHIEDDTDFVQTCTHYLKEDGLIVINVPALNALYSKYDKVDGHKRRYDKKRIRAIFKACNLEEVDIRYWGFTLLPLIFIRKYILHFVSEEKAISTGFKPPHKLFNWFFDKLLRLEEAIFASPVRGTSLIAIGRVTKPNKN